MPTIFGNPPRMQSGPFGDVAVARYPRIALAGHPWLRTAPERADVLEARTGCLSLDGQPKTLQSSCRVHPNQLCPPRYQGPGAALVRLKRNVLTVRLTCGEWESSQARRKGSG